MFKSFQKVLGVASGIFNIAKAAGWYSVIFCAFVVSPIFLQIQLEELEENMRKAALEANSAATTAASEVAASS